MSLVVLHSMSDLSEKAAPNESSNAQYPSVGGQRCLGHTIDKVCSFQSPMTGYNQTRAAVYSGS